MPPRHAKTETVTVRFAPYFLEGDPSCNVLITGYNERFARRLSRKARKVAASRMELDGSKTAVDEWATLQGGVLMARGVGSPPTGTGFKLIVIDDPIRRRQDADSETHRESDWDWYTDDLYSRLEPGGAIILVATTWHEDDLCARAVASEPNKWRVLKLPAIAYRNDDALGRSLGAALWPDRYPVEALQRIRAVIARAEGERSWEALYQQNPTPLEGTFFKTGKLTIVDAVPANVRWVRAWDLAATKDDGDYTAGVKIGSSQDGKYFVADVARDQWSSDEVDDNVKLVAGLDGRSVSVHGPQDPGQAGKKAAAAFVRMLGGYDVKTEPVSGEKTLRAKPFSSQVNAGNVFLVRGTWNKDFVEELRTFPNGKHDDQVDAAADGFNELTSGGWTHDNETLGWLATR